MGWRARDDGSGDRSEEAWRGGLNRVLALFKSTGHCTSIRTSGVAICTKRLQNWGTEDNWRRVPPSPPVIKILSDTSRSDHPASLRLAASHAPIRVRLGALTKREAQRRAAWLGTPA